MCGRVRQHRYAEYPHLWNRKLGPVEPGLTENVPPGTTPVVLHRLDGQPHCDRLHWGYHPAWSERGPVSSARLDKLLGGAPFWRNLRTHRLIMPVDGWYEWTGEKGDRQPWYISSRDGEPILLAGITAWHPGAERDPEHGFAIVTDDTAGGMVDIHDRRPVALTLDDARAWADPAISVAQALELLSTARPESAFQWWQVTRSMSNSRYQREDASLPL